MKSSNSACPLCKTSFTAVFCRVEGALIEEAIDCPPASSTPSPESGNDNLECLDHSFCLVFIYYYYYDYYYYYYDFFFFFFFLVSHPLSFKRRKSGVSLGKQNERGKTF